MKKNKRLLVFLFLLVIIAGIYWFAQGERKVKAFPAHFIVHDSAINITGDNLIIKVWDYSAVDRDTVNILFDGKMIFKHLGITDTPVVYHTKKLAKGEHWVGVEGIDEGALEPASPHISIDNGSQIFDFELPAFINKPVGRKIFIK